MKGVTTHPSSHARLQMHLMLPVVYVKEAVDFEGEGHSCIESVRSGDGSAWMLGIGMVGREGWVGGGG